VHPSDVVGVDLFLHPRGESPSRQHVEMTFDVADVDAAIERLRRAGVPVLEEPADREGATATPPSPTPTPTRSISARDRPDRPRQPLSAAGVEMSHL
jgi:hypothetical protein